MFIEKKKRSYLPVLIGQYRKIFALSLFETEGKYFSIQTSKPVNNIYVLLFSQGILQQIPIGIKNMFYEKTCFKKKTSSTLIKKNRKLVLRKKNTCFKIFCLASARNFTNSMLSCSVKLNVHGNTENVLTYEKRILTQSQKNISEPSDFNSYKRWSPMQHTHDYRV